ncbi:MAG: TIGR01906 family membrane protein [Candidatus Nanoarchaeia archaeon]|nr:TIGR01906 family membrane protein [Candidatus Nanoarchaeia archaeon]
MKTKLIIILFPFLILLLSYNLVAYNIDFYKHEFEKHGVYNELPKETVNKEAQNLISYMKNKTPLELGFFNEGEIAHMEDVYNTNKLFSYLFYISVILVSILILSLLYSKQYKEIFISLFYGGIATLGVIISLVILFSLFFTSSFTIFHEVFFNNDLWQLNPEYDKMIVMFPEPFFFDAVIRVLLYSAGFSLILGIFGFTLKHFSLQTSS